MNNIIKHLYSKTILLSFFSFGFQMDIIKNSKFLLKELKLTLYLPLFLYLNKAYNKKKYSIFYELSSIYNLFPSISQEKIKSVIFYFLRKISFFHEIPVTIDIKNLTNNDYINCKYGLKKFNLILNCFTDSNEIISIIKKNSIYLNKLNELKKISFHFSYKTDNYERIEILKNLIDSGFIGKNIENLEFEGFFNIIKIYDEFSNQNCNILLEEEKKLLEDFYKSNIKELDINIINIQEYGIILTFLKLLMRLKNLKTIKLNIYLVSILRVMIKINFVENFKNLNQLILNFSNYIDTNLSFLKDTNLAKKVTQIISFNLSQFDLTLFPNLEEVNLDIKNYDNLNKLKNIPTNQLKKLFINFYNDIFPYNYIYDLLNMCNNIEIINLKFCIGKKINFNDILKIINIISKKNNINLNIELLKNNRIIIELLCNKIVFITNQENHNDINYFDDFNLLFLNDYNSINSLIIKGNNQNKLWNSKLFINNLIYIKYIEINNIIINKNLLDNIFQYNNLEYIKISVFEFKLDVLSEKIKNLNKLKTLKILQNNKFINYQEKPINLINLLKFNKELEEIIINDLIYTKNYFQKFKKYFPLIKYPE